MIKPIFQIIRNVMLNCIIYGNKKGATYCSFFDFYGLLFSAN
ncbi:hypothetical protein PCARR_a3240 [Pseudoalteromonas carrageenovora IAM 12662]|uniref:Uncharacterized protein n=1 Tax=Pseudoalteromonas carrageenovora IAM 12662 TaxID=1314868 RepID=A0ABR9ELX4_PSEVC|nr:hypothetical protein [Pseudoalteromonas carrageenovora IAM 12662]